ncbi:UNVERIFIED_CONTAM: hypothetical protein Scaly_2186800 [Sesamum calycinum]|uniref:RNase H type-1 domain-containing protein n=1 Tax=Sesamum calycinum TaxID=2727403 RepID=A0AAW2MPH1_9LAMI
MVTQRGIEANPLKIKAILDIKALANVDEVQGLTGRIAALSSFISKTAAEKSLPYFKAIGSILVHEKEGKQILIYYVSKVLNGAEGRSAPIKKITLALVVTLRRLCPYFLSHPVEVKINLPLKQMLRKPVTSRRLVKWAVELSKSRTTIKAQALVDFIFEMAGISLGDTPKIEKWLLHVDGSSTIQGSGARVVVTSPHGEDLEFAIKFDFKASNNETKYEALLIGMKMAHEVGARHLVAYSDS